MKTWLLGALFALATLPATLPVRAADPDARPDADLPAIGQLTGPAGRCTAFLAGSDRVVVTAAHCVLDAAGESTTQEWFDFQPGLRPDGSSAGLYRAKLVVKGNWRPPGDPRVLVEPIAEDWAVLLTDRATGLAPLALSADLPLARLADRPLAVIGYAVDVEQDKLAVEDATCQVTGLDDFRIDHSCRGGRTSAGAPLFLMEADGTRGAVIGVVTRGGVTSVTERLAITHLRNLSAVPGMPRVDFGGRAVYVGAFVNAARMAGVTGIDRSAMR